MLPLYPCQKNPNQSNKKKFQITFTNKIVVVVVVGGGGIVFIGSLTYV